MSEYVIDSSLRMAVNPTLSTWSHAIPYLWLELLTDETKGNPLDNN